MPHIVSGPDTAAVPMQINQTPPFLRSVCAIIESMFKLRHCTSKHIHIDDMDGLVLKDGLYQRPVLHGGTFKEVAQRAWSNPEMLTDKSASFVHKVGLTDSLDTAEFLQEFCKIQDTCLTCFKR